MIAQEPSPSVFDPELTFGREVAALRRLAHRVFDFLLSVQWVAAVACAAWLSPLTWSGVESAPHYHVVAAVLLGGALTLFPNWLIRRAPSHPASRHVAAAAQLLFSALFIHLMGGRIEAHFHVFGSLALLAFYRDPWVFVPAVGVTLVDHVLRGLLWPESIFGVATPSLGRALEHAGWVVFETVFLLWGIAQSLGHLRSLALMQASLAEERDGLEVAVENRAAELIEAHDYLENVIESLDAHLCILDHQGRILSTNKAWRAFGHYRNADPDRCGDGANYLTVCRSATGPGSDSAVRLADAIELVIRGDSAGCVVEYECHDPGAERWFQARVSPFVGRGDAAVVVAHVEVTDRVLATRASEEEASRVAALARIITDSPNELYIFRQSDLGFEMVNQGAVEATGYSRDELLGMGPAGLIPDLGADGARNRIAPLLDGRLAAVDFQTEHRRKDGLVYPVQVSLHAADFNDTPVVVAFVTDLSETRRLEGRLAQSQKLEAIGQLAAGIAHEINTPMQCVSNNVEFLHECHERMFDLVDRLIATVDCPSAATLDERKAAVKALVDETRYERIASQAPAAIQDAAEASRRIVEIVRAMKAMSHPGTREKILTDVNESLRNAATISKNRWKYVADLDFQLDDTLPEVPALPAELNQVFLNLIVNAADAIAEKSGEGGELGRITIRSRVEDGRARVEIDDTGSGVSEAIRARVFDPFFTTKQVGKGTGQGLAISYDVVVNKHGGTIDLLSTEGEGTTFVICLPLESIGEPAAALPELAARAD